MVQKSVPGVVFAYHAFHNQELGQDIGYHNGNSRMFERMAKPVEGNERVGYEEKKCPGEHKQVAGIVHLPVARKGRNDHAGNHDAVKGNRKKHRSQRRHHGIKRKGAIQNDNEQLEFLETEEGKPAGRAKKGKGVKNMSDEEGRQSGNKIHLIHPGKLEQHIARPAKKQGRHDEPVAEHRPLRKGGEKEQRQRRNNGGLQNDLQNGKVQLITENKPDPGKKIQAYGEDIPFDHAQLISCLS